MNFKEMYKSANNQIQGDRNLIDEIFKKSEKKPAFRIIYPAACAVAALAIVFTLALYPENTGNEKQQINIASNTHRADLVHENKAVTNDSFEIPKAKESEKIPVKESVGEKNVKSIEPENASLPEDNFKVNSDVDEPVIEEGGDTVYDTSKSAAMETETAPKAVSNDVPANDNVMLAMLDVNDVQTSVAAVTEDIQARSSDSGGAASVSRFEYEGLTAEQYYAYIGVNLTEKLQLPQDMKFEEFFGAAIKKDSGSESVVGDEAEFYASGGNRYLTISTTKLSGEAAVKLNNTALKKSDIGGMPAVIEGYESTYRTYIKFGEVYYNIYSDGLTEEELKALLLSICTNNGK